jgi:proteasome accessory factor C
MSSAQHGSAGARLTRLLELVPWLLARPGISLQETAAHFGVSTNQLVSDLDLLICSGPGQFHGELLDIWYDGEGGITVQDPLSLTRPLRLTGEEAAALLAGLRLLAQVPGGQDRQTVARVTASLEAAAGSAAGAVAALDVAVDRPLDPEVVATVERALAQGQVLTLRYAGAARDTETERDVVPDALLWLDGRPYLSAWCRSAGAMRTFRLDRVRSARLLPEHASVPADAVGPDLGSGALRPQGPPLTIDLAPEARWVADEYPVESVRPRPDGGIRVVLAVADTRWVVRLLLRLGGLASVVAPPEIAAAVAQEARQALAAYDSAETGPVHPNGQ